MNPTTVKIAFYKAPGTWADQLIRVVTQSRYSHCELVINGTSCSSSVRDGGVRFKTINFDPERWDVVDIPHADAAAVWDWFCRHCGEGYDHLGALRFVVPVIPHRRNRWFCSEACAAALRLPDPHKWAPKHLAEKYALGD